MRGMERDQRKIIRCCLFVTGGYDIALALMAVQTQTTEVLDTFPTIPVVQEAEQILAEAENPEVTIPQEA